MNDDDGTGAVRRAAHINGLGRGPATADQVADHFREPGWYRDPDQPRRHRYWDGARWGPHVPALAQEPAEPRPMLDAEDLPRPRREMD